MGFGKINPINIRMLPGSQYETEEDRLKFGIKAKFRPIFGSYGIIDGQRVFEIEESVRATKDMSESELDSFKILHWLIYFFWNIGFCKSILRFAQDQGINPGLILYRLCSTENPVLSAEFNKMKQQSMSEWMDTKEGAIAHYEQQEHFDAMVHDFVKLNQLWIAEVFQNPLKISSLFGELVKIVKSLLDHQMAQGMLDELVDFEEKLICVDLLQDEFSDTYTVAGKMLSYVMDDRSMAETESFEVEIYRTKEDVDFCNYYLNPGGSRDLSIQNVTRFIEMGGKGLKNRIRIVE
jgi:sugar-specific transcriptional regulator TrmB